MIKIFATFNGCKRGPSNGAYLGPPSLIWGNVTDADGNPIGDMTSNKSKITESKVFRKGNRYILECSEATDNKIKRIKTINAVRKENSCNLFKDSNKGFKMINGKYKNKYVSDIPKKDLTNYLTWVRENSNNEVTLSNISKIVKQLY